MTMQCAWCKKIIIPGDRMVSFPTGVISHGICPACRGEVMSEFRDHLRKDDIPFPTTSENSQPESPEYTESLHP